MAFSIRNFARFYRATEDFYRRMYRVVRYNPEAIVKASLTYEGVTHSGWVQNDDQGEPYFIYPGTQYVYKAVQAAIQRRRKGRASTILTSPLVDEATTEKKTLLGM